MIIRTDDTPQEGYKPAMKRLPIRDILWLFLMTRLLLLVITYIAYILLTAPKYSTTGVDVQALLSAWNHWDAANYVRIAQFGYQTRYDTAFFPLFPVMIRVLAFPFSGGAYLLAGTLISNAALLGTLCILYQLALDFGGEEVARRTLLYLCIFPTAFFFFAAYNESLFLLLSSGVFLALRRQHWWLAGLLGLLATLTRSAGIILVAPYLCEVWVSRHGLPTPATWLSTIRRALPVLLVPIGLLLYSLYCWHIVGSPLAFATVQSHWGRALAWPWEGLIKDIGEIFWLPFGSFYQVHDLLDLSATIGFLTLTVFAWRRLRASYALWTTLLVLYVLLSPGITTIDPLVSNQRFILEMFPLFITLAILGSEYPRLHQSILLIFPVLLATLSILFLIGKWMV